jgi:hypothetical protein
VLSGHTDIKVAGVICSHRLVKTMAPPTRKIPIHSHDVALDSARRVNPGAIELLRLYERIMKTVDIEFAIEADSRPPIEYHTAGSTTY